MSKIISDAEIGRKIKEYRLQAGMTQEGLAEKLDITFQQVQKYERGVTKVNLVRLQQLAEVLRVPVATFFDDSAYKAFLLPDSEMKLLQAFRDIKSAENKKSVMDIITGLAKKKA